jgi:hypothetical protein
MDLLLRVAKGMCVQLLDAWVIRRKLGAKELDFRIPSSVRSRAAVTCNHQIG